MKSRTNSDINQLVEDPQVEQRVDQNSGRVCAPRQVYDDEQEEYVVDRYDSSYEDNRYISSQIESSENQTTESGIRTGTSKKGLEFDLTTSQKKNETSGCVMPYEAGSIALTSIFDLGQEPKPFDTGLKEPI